MSHEGYHEPHEKLPESVRAMHRAITSLMEELEAIDWYYQRAAVTEDEALKAVLLHNAHEEIEHAMMVLEWIRRSDPKFDVNMREYLFKEGSIVGAEAAATGRDTAEARAAASDAAGGVEPPYAGGRGGGEGGSGGGAVRRARATLGSLRGESRGEGGAR